MTDPSKPSGDLFDELFTLGGNLTKLVRAAWDSPERKKRQGELEAALTDLTNTLNRAGMEFMVSPTGQRIYSELQGVRERIRKGGLEATAYEELLSILQRLNAELARASEKMKGEGGGSGEKP
jgi:hypothetical protein